MSWNRRGRYFLMGHGKNERYIFTCESSNSSSKYLRFDMQLNVFKGMVVPQLSLVLRLLEKQCGTCFVQKKHRISRSQKVRLIQDPCNVWFLCTYIWFIFLINVGIHIPFLPWIRQVVKPSRPGLESMKLLPTCWGNQVCLNREPSNKKQ